MKNIDTAFRQLRLFTLVIIVGIFFVSALIVFKSFSWVKAEASKVYVLYNGKLLEATAIDRKQDMPLEIRDHVKTFHHYFFTLSPDEKAITKNIGKALYLADNSAKQVYDNLKEKGYYSSLISGNVSQQVEVDSISLNLDNTPYYFRCFARQIVTRTTSLVIRTLITEGYVRTDMAKSDNNMHGFLIERWNIIDNRDIEVKQR